MNQKQRTVAALVALFVVAGTAYGFLQWQARPAVFVAPELATTTQSVATTTNTKPAPVSPPLTASDHQFGTVTLKLNEMASFPDGLAIRPIDVLEDSRCPMGVFCIQAGTVRLSVRIQSALGMSVQEVALNKTVTTEADDITLVGVEPVKRRDVQTGDGDYLFTFEVKQRNIDTTKRCFVGGCSAQLCTDDPDAASTCEYRAEYACYKTAECKRQQNGQCGWTETKELKACLKNPPELH